MATRGFNTWRWEEWGTPGTDLRGGDVHLKPFTWPSGVVSWTNALIIPAVTLLRDVFQSYGYEVGSAGSYNYRKITNGTVWSPHAWALAIDINPADNPYGYVFKTDIPMDLIRSAYKIEAQGQRVWKWGGDWDGDWNFDEHTIFDAMHFEVIATPTELSQGVYFDDVAQEPQPVLKLGDRGLTVYDMRAGLSGYFQNPDIMFGAADPQLFDSHMVEWVKSFQVAYGLPATGSIDGVTAVQIRSWVRPRKFD